MNYSKSRALLIFLIVISASLAQTTGVNKTGTRSSSNECHISCGRCSKQILTSCSNCNDGYFHHSAAACLFTCPSPYTFLDFNDQDCKACSSFCQLCIESASNCNNCTKGTYYRPDTDSCASSCPEDAGFYKSTTERRCIPCRDPNCLNCNAIGECLKCRDYWPLEPATGRCARPCAQGCKFCSKGSSSCDECEAGWIKNETIARDPANSSVGQENSSNALCQCSHENCHRCGVSTCETCREGHFKNESNQCVACGTGCGKCNSAQSCETCYSGFFNSEGSCRPCPSGCRYCVSETDCTSCENGYYMKGARPNRTCQSKSIYAILEADGSHTDEERSSGDDKEIFAFSDGSAGRIYYSVNFKASSAGHSSTSSSSSSHSSSSSSSSHSNSGSGTSSSPSTHSSPAPGASSSSSSGGSSKGGSDTSSSISKATPVSKPGSSAPAAASVSGRSAQPSASSAAASASGRSAQPSASPAAPSASAPTAAPSASAQSTQRASASSAASVTGSPSVTSRSTATSSASATSSRPMNSSTGSDYNNGGYNNGGYNNGGYNNGGYSPSTPYPNQGYYGASSSGSSFSGILGFILGISFLCCCCCCLLPLIWKGNSGRSQMGEPLNSYEMSDIRY